MCGHVRQFMVLCIILWTIYLSYLALDCRIYESDQGLYMQNVCIAMGTCCAPLVADLFLFCYERHARIQKVLPEGVQL